MKEKKTKRKNLLKNLYSNNFILIFIPLAIILAGILWWFFHQDVRKEKEIVEEQTAHTIDIQKNTIAQDFASVISDLLILSDWHELQEVLEGRDPNEYLSKEYLSFSKRKRIYDQVRFLNEEGNEMVRINFNNGSPYIVAKDKLQQKKDRYYFGDTFALSQGEVYVSQFDLNIEHEEIEQPLKPMIRFGTPVFDKNGQKRGIVVLNYLAAKTINDFVSKSLLAYGHPLLLNQEGFWLKGINPQDEWGFMYEDGENKVFENEFPKAWGRISKEKKGQFYTKEGLFTFVAVFPVFEALEKLNIISAPSEEAKKYFWKVVSFVPSPFLKGSPSEIIKEFIILYVFLLFLIALASWMFSAAIAKRKEAQVKIQDVIDMKLNFVSFLSHELRSPLVIMKGGIDVITEGLMGKISDDQKEILTRVKKGMDRLNRLTTEVLDFQKIESGKLQLKTEMHNINKVIKEFQKTAVDAIKKKGLELTVNLEANLPDIECDQDKIVQVLTNLVNNALKFTEKGKITISSSREDNFIKVSVKDSGPGIDKDELHKLFQGFYQLSNARKMGTGGTGLGLAISKGIVKNHHGRIWAESELGKGSTFSFILPITVQRR